MNNSNSDKKCMVQKGIFTLRNCDAKAFVKCVVCGKLVCPKHLQQDVGSRVICIECQAKEYNLKHPSSTISRSKIQLSIDDMWYYSTRFRYYERYHYTPFTTEDRDVFNTVAGLTEDGDFENSTEDFFNS
jgi:hypothetical protein